jgi:hypothetical protein
MANERYQAARGLNYQEKRMADQQAREAFAARGRLNDNASVSAEILNREDFLASKRKEAAQYGMQASQMAEQHAAPALNLLGNTSQSTLLGQDYLNRASSSVGQSIPQLVDTGTGITLGQQHQANLANWQSNAVAADNARSAQTTQAASSIASAAIMAIALSDENLKTDKKKVGKTKGGLDVYTYRMIGEKDTQTGVMAQDVAATQPHAAGPMIGAHRSVNYAAIE